MRNEEDTEVNHLFSRFVNFKKKYVTIHIFGYFHTKLNTENFYVIVHDLSWQTCSTFDGPRFESPC